MLFLRPSGCPPPFHLTGSHTAQSALGGWWQKQRVTGAQRPAERAQRPESVAGREQSSLSLGGGLLLKQKQQLLLLVSSQAVALGLPFFALFSL